MLRATTVGWYLRLAAAAAILLQAPAGCDETGTVRAAIANGTQTLLSNVVGFLAETGVNRAFGY